MSPSQLRRIERNRREAQRRRRRARMRSLSASIMDQLHDISRLLDLLRADDDCQQRHDDDTSAVLLQSMDISDLAMRHQLGSLFRLWNL